MKHVLYFLILLFPLHAHSLERPDIEFRVFQFPHDMMPRIDGSAEDWSMVPDSYRIGLDQLEDTTYHVPTDPKDKDITVTVGWVEGLSRLYFLVEAYDDYWDFSEPGLHNDILELVVDGDLSGGGFLPRDHPAKELLSGWRAFSTFHGVYAQNYHVFLPAEGKQWTMVWGCNPWISGFPRGNAASSYDFRPGESGNLTLEFWITPYDYAPYEGPSRAVVSKLSENSIIGLSWSVLEYDGTHDTGRFKAFWNLSHKSSMLGNASDLCRFRLMPVEPSLKEPVTAEWDFTIIDMDRRLVAFKDLSEGEITKWTWEFGDGEISHEQNPVHEYTRGDLYFVTVLTVEGPDGKARMAKTCDVAIR